MASEGVSAQAERMARELVEILSGDAELAFDFYCAASEIVDDFEDHGPQLTSTDAGEYDGSTPIGRLQAARNVIIAQLQRRSSERGSG
jgi:hypothetical protein